MEQKGAKSRRGEGTTSEREKGRDSLSLPDRIICYWDSRPKGWTVLFPPRILGMCRGNGYLEGRQRTDCRGGMDVLSNSAQGSPPLAFFSFFSVLRLTLFSDGRRTVLEQLIIVVPRSRLGDPVVNSPLRR